MRTQQNKKWDWYMEHERHEARRVREAQGYVRH